MLETDFLHLIPRPEEMQFIGSTKELLGAIVNSFEIRDLDGQAPKDSLDFILVAREGAVDSLPERPGQLHDNSHEDHQCFELAIQIEEACQKDARRVHERISAFSRDESIPCD